MLCRDSDYRTVANSPDWNVISVKADVVEDTYAMLMVVKARNVTSGDTAIVLYVLEAWLCHVTTELTTKAEVEQARIKETHNGFEVTSQTIYIVMTPSDDEGALVLAVYDAKAEN